MKKNTLKKLHLKLTYFVSVTHLHSFPRKLWTDKTSGNHVLTRLQISGLLAIGDRLWWEADRDILPLAYET